MRGSKIIALALVLSATTFSHVTLATGGHSGGCSTPSSDPSSPDVCDSPLGDNTYNLVDDGIEVGTDASVLDAVNVAGVNIVVSAWSDTNGGSDNIVVGGTIYKISDTLGYGITNADEASFDSDSYSHAIDNSGNAVDFDYILFTFDSAVTLTGANFGWAQTKTNSQVSVAALDNLSLLTSGSSTWASIAGSALAKGSYDILECATGYVSEFNFTQTAKYWLVGAYNINFGNLGGQSYDDAFKLVAVGFDKATTPGGGTHEASAPGSLALLMLGGGLLAWRRKRAA